MLCVVEPLATHGEDLMLEQGGPDGPSLVRGEGLPQVDPAEPGPDGCATAATLGCGVTSSSPTSVAVSSVALASARVPSSNSHGAWSSITCIGRGGAGGPPDTACGAVRLDERLRQRAASLLLCGSDGLIYTARCTGDRSQSSWQ